MVLFTAGFKILLFNLINLYICYTTVYKSPRQWRCASAKRTQRKIQRYKNWKRRRLKKDFRAQRVVLEWGSEPVDVWSPPDTNNIPQLFSEICIKCPQFYDIGIRTDFVNRMLTEMKADCFFLGENNSTFQDLLLPDRPGFLYYNEALEDLPIIFDTGASVSVSPDLKDFIEYKPVKGTHGLTNITGESAVQGTGQLCWELYSDTGKKKVIMTKGYYVPEAKVRLFSVQSYLGTEKGSFVLEGTQSLFCFKSGDILSFATFDKTTGRSRLPLAYLTKATDI